MMSVLSRLHANKATIADAMAEQEADTDDAAPSPVSAGVTPVSGPYAGVPPDEIAAIEARYAEAVGYSDGPQPVQVMPGKRLDINTDPFFEQETVVDRERALLEKEFADKRAADLGLSGVNASANVATFPSPAGHAPDLTVGTVSSQGATVGEADEADPAPAENVESEEEKKAKAAAAEQALALDELPDDAPPELKEMQASFAAMMAHGLAALRTESAESRLMKEAAAGRNLAEAAAIEEAQARAMQPGGGGGGGGGRRRLFGGGQRAATRQAQRAVNLRRDAAVLRSSGPDFSHRMLSQRIREADAASRSYYAQALALKETMGSLNGKLRTNEQAKIFFDDVDNYISSQPKPTTREAVFADMRKGKGGAALALLRKDAENLSKDPEIKALFDQATSLRGEMQGTAKKLASAVAGLPKTEANAAEIQKIASKMDAGAENSLVPNLGGKKGPKLEENKKELEEQIKKITDAIMNAVKAMFARFSSALGR